MKNVAKSLLSFVFAVLMVHAWAADPVATWTDFNMLTSGSYTLTKDEACTVNADGSITLDGTGLELTFSLGQPIHDNNSIVVVMDVSSVPNNAKLVDITTNGQSDNLYYDGSKLYQRAGTTANYGNYEWTATRATIIYAYGGTIDNAVNGTVTYLNGLKIIEASGLKWTGAGRNVTKLSLPAAGMTIHSLRLYPTTEVRAAAFATEAANISTALLADTNIEFNGNNNIVVKGENAAWLPNGFNFNMPSSYIDTPTGKGFLVTDNGAIWPCSDHGNNNIPTDGDYTVAIYANTSDVTDNATLLWIGHNTWGGGNAVSLMKTDADTVSVRRFNGGTGTVYAEYSSEDLAKDAYRLYVVTVDNEDDTTTINLYVDGVKTAGTVTTKFTADKKIQIGNAVGNASQIGLNHASGMIVDNFYGWNKALTDAEVAALTSVMKPIPAPSTYIRTIDANANWSTTEAWTLDGVGTVADVPAEGKDATITATADATFTVNAAANVGIFTTAGAGTLTIATDGTNKLTAQKTSIEANTIVSPNAAYLGATTIAEGKALTVSDNAMSAVIGGGKLVKKNETGLLELDGDVSGVVSTYEINEGTLKISNTISRSGGLQYYNGNAPMYKVASGAKLIWDSNDLIGWTRKNDVTVAEISGTLEKTRDSNETFSGRMLLKDGGELRLSAPDEKFMLHNSAVIAVDQNAKATITGNRLKINDGTPSFDVAEGANLTVSAPIYLGTTFEKKGSGVWTQTSQITGASHLRVLKGSLVLSITDALVANGSAVVELSEEATLVSGDANTTFYRTVLGSGTIIVPEEKFLAIGESTGYTGEQTSGLSRFEGTLEVAGTFDARSWAGSDREYVIGACNVTVSENGRIVRTAGGGRENNLSPAKIVIASGKTLSGTGTIEIPVTLADGATLAGAVTVNGNVTVAGALTITHATVAGDTVITCANADAVAADLTGAPEGLKYVAENGVVKLAAAQVYVTPDVSVTVNSEEAANAVQLSITPPAGLTAEQGAAYVGYFKKFVKDNGNGTWTVTAQLDPDVVRPTIAETTEGGDAFVVNSDGSVKLNINEKLPGLYYGVEVTSSINGTVYAVVPETENGLVVPTQKIPGGSTAFFRVIVDFNQIQAIDPSTEPAE